MMPLPSASALATAALRLCCKVKETHAAGVNSWKFLFLLGLVSSSGSWRGHQHSREL